jgi:hypothetical protein
MKSILKENKNKTQKFIKNEKNAEINRENQILLNKLVEISNGKWSSVSKPAPKKVKKAGPTKKSLNYERRKKEFERIERENMAIAQRLFNKQGSISKKKMDEEYKVHRKYKKQIQKAEGVKSKKKGKLAPGEERKEHPEDGEAVPEEPAQEADVSKDAQEAKSPAEPAKEETAKEETAKAEPDKKDEKVEKAESPKAEEKAEEKSDDKKEEKSEEKAEEGRK